MDIKRLKDSLGGGHRKHPQWAPSDLIFPGDTALTNLPWRRSSESAKSWWRLWTVIRFKASRRYERNQRTALKKIEQQGAKSRILSAFHRQGYPLLNAVGELYRNSDIVCS